MSDSTVPVSTRLNNEEVAKLERLAVAAGVSKAMILKLLVRAVDEKHPPFIQAHVTWKVAGNE